MTHGGGTVAGESPDRAEQQGSSQETVTPGGGRDPRLSVLRESEPSSSEPAARVQVDQPTAVFKTLAPRTPEDDAPRQADDVTESADAGTESAADAGTESAADVVTETSASGTAETPGTAETAEAPEASGASGAESEPESARLKAAVTAWMATADRAAAPEADGGAAAGTSEASGASEAPEAPEDAPEVDSDAPEADDPADDPADEPEADEPEPGDDPEDDDPEDEPEPEVDDEGDEEPVEDRAAVEDKAADEDRTAAEASAASWFAARKSDAAAKAAEEPAKASAGEPAVKPVAEPAAEAPAEPADDAPAPASAPAPDEPVDQPTTMFKMVRPPAAPAVDQPTTALKLPPGLAADADSERTSTFLPLRPDIPAERKAEEARAARQAPAAPSAPSRPSPAAPSAPSPAQAPAAAKPAAPAERADVPPAALAEPERTRQQPLPPLPPLDLLAELTNTPPPAPSAVRTTVRRVRIWTPLVLLVLIVFAIVQMVRPLPAPVLTLSAAPTFTFQGGALDLPWPNEGQGAIEVEGVGSMGQYGPQTPAPIASVTKTMTAYVILRDHPIKGKAGGPEITIDKKAAEQAGAAHESTAAVKEGQVYTERELLELLMVPSANNVARLLARWDAGSEAAFVEKMNAAAKDLGMTQSVYTDPSGLLDTTMSTPQDQLRLAKAVMQFDVFREIVNMPNMTVDGIPGRIENNNNILLHDGVNGIKTGSSTPAGGNLLWSANTVVDGKNRRILGIVMGAKDAKLLNDKLQLAIDNSLKLIQAAQKDVTSAAVVKKGQVLGYIDDGLGGRTEVVATKELKAIGWPGLQVKLELTDGGKVVPHSGKAGDIIGQVSIGTGAGKVSSPVALGSDLVEPGFDKKLTRLG
ncbi:D-alanyl-D-alanine carboxypeptidase [Streptomyces wedmorensis]|uniref:D-alanyl-D-alanine carboxypeptidase n=1 Tax=Streptomyces wedmorensis TaxID=43759 RepID=UPI0037BDEE42